MRVILIHNPGAGEGGHTPKTLAAAIAAAGHDVYRVVSREEPLREELTGRADLVAVAGGDGTVREVFKRMAGRSTPVTVIPLGTANNIARGLGIDADADPAALAAGWDGGRLQRYDVGTCYYGADERTFVESTGGGLFAEVLVRAEEHGDPAGDDKLELGLRLLRDVLRDAPVFEFRVEVDGRDLSRELIGIEVTNVPETGPQVPLDPGVDPGDGLFEVVMIDPTARDSLMGYVEQRLAGRDPDPPMFETHSGRRIALGLPRGAPLHLDDEMVIDDAPEEGIRAVAVTAGSAVTVLVAALSA
jgi:diacylglycerol kinase (ATP)